MELSACIRPIVRATPNAGLKTPIISTYQLWSHHHKFHHSLQTSCLASQRRDFHSRRHVSITAATATQTVDSDLSKHHKTESTTMSCLPLSTLIRSYIITAVSSVPFLLRPSLTMLGYLANSKSRILNPDRNPLLKMLLKKTFYAQFCAGETPVEVRRTLLDLKSMGYQGVIMGHAREVVLTEQEEAGLATSLDCAAQEACTRKEIATWTQSTLDTIALAGAGDFVSLKFTGAGREALQSLKETIPCSPDFEAALHRICKAAAENRVCLLVDAEQASLQQGIDNWTLFLMKAYNGGDKALVYGTYQAYAKRTPALLSQHLASGAEHGFTVGVKLVRGAYIGSDPRHLFWDCIDDTHKCYDNLAECVLRRQYQGLLQPTNKNTAKFPNVDLVLASHNIKSVHRARSIRDEQVYTGSPRIRLSYGQLMGMADNVSCEIVHEAQERSMLQVRDADIPQAYKYVVWGSLGECMKYLLRRAQENKDAVSRTISARQALGKELLHRFGLSR